MADRNFEQEVQQQMEQFKLHPSKEVWLKVDAQLRKDKRRRWFFILVSTIALLGIVGGIMYTSEQKQPVLQQIISMPNQSITKTDDNNKTPSLVPAGSATPSQEKKAIPDEPITVKQNISTAALTKNSDLIKKDETAFVKNKKEPLAISQTATPKKTNKAVVQQPTDNTTKGSVIVFFPPSKRKTAAVAEKQDTSEVLLLLPQSPINSQSIVNTKDSSSFSIAAQQPIAYKKNDSTSVTSSIPAPPKEKRKWQRGIQFNLGLADIVESILPGSEYKRAESIPYFSQGGITGVPNTISGITVSEYNVTSSITIVASYLLRKKVFKQSLFVTGIQYQYNQFTVNQRISRDTFSVAQNRLVNDFSNEQTTSYSFHYISIPTELQWHLAKTTKGNIMLGTGLLHSFRLSSTDGLPAFISNSSGPAFYQPIVQLTPSYEWTAKKSAMQLGWYFNYGVLPVYNNSSKNHWWQTGLRLQLFFNKK